MILVGPALPLPMARSMSTPGIAGQLGPYPDSEAWCEALLEEHGVALTPGTDFDQRDGGAAVRLSLAAGPEAVATAIIRILRFQQSLQELTLRPEPVERAPMPSLRQA